MGKPVATATFLLCLVLVTNAFGQTSNATLGGTVSDASRALVPGVTITATNNDTGVVTTVLSNESGAYQFPNLQTGTYKVGAALPGFRSQTYSDVVLGIAQQVLGRRRIIFGGLGAGAQPAEQVDFVRQVRADGMAGRGFRLTGLGAVAGGITGPQLRPQT